ncbi:hypothetical protein IT571_10655 [Candidatus Sumerlaeota bacterium]|nr:hypothetical protein [Candidatus Sumerlaeota bacterium]
MVNGLSRFREAFTAHQDQFTLIGGAAASEWFDQAGLQFRATKDLDVVLLLECIDDGFLRTFWAFVREGGYRTKQRSDGSRGYYRFMRPSAPDFPSMLELFARQADGLVIAEDQEIVPIPPEEDASSLSAILMDPDYYRVVMEHREVVDDLPLLSPAGLIALRARAWLDLSARRERGEQVKMEDIKKHRNDVFRLGLLLAADSHFIVSQRVQDDLWRFLDAHAPTSDVWQEIMAAVERTARIEEPSEAVQALRQAFVTLRL